MFVVRHSRHRLVGLMLLPLLGFAAMLPLNHVHANGHSAHYPLLHTNSQLDDMTLGPDGNLWFTEALLDQPSGAIAMSTPDGTITEYSLPTPASVPRGITVGPDGNLWFAETSGIGTITLQGIITEYPLPNPASLPDRITAGPDGNLWFTESHGIGTITPQGIITEYAVPPVPGESTPLVTVGPTSITAGPDGNLWFTAQQSNVVGNITPQGSITQYTLPNPASGPFSITAGPDGNLWFTETGFGVSGRIGTITPQGAITEYALAHIPFDITAGPNNLWFTETDGNALGMITPGGVINEFNGKTSVNPTYIRRGPQATVWFAENPPTAITRGWIGQVSYY